MKRKHPTRGLPSTSLPELYRDAEPPRTKPRVAETTQYTRSNRRARDLPKIERRVTRSQTLSRSRSPPTDPLLLDFHEAGGANPDAKDQIEVAWWDARVTESSAFSDGKASAKCEAKASRSTRSSSGLSTRNASARKKPRISRGSLTEEDRIDDHDPKMSEDYAPLSPPLPDNGSREKRQNVLDVNGKPGRDGSPDKTTPAQNVDSMIATGDYIPFSPDSPLAARHHQGFYTQGHRHFSPATSRLRTRIGNESPIRVGGADGPAMIAVAEQTTVPQVEEEISATDPATMPQQTEVGASIWNSDFLNAQEGQGEVNRIWPARKGGVYCEACFRDECIRWIRIRDKVMSVSRLLGGDEVLQKRKPTFRRSREMSQPANGGNAPKSIILPDQMKNRTEKLFRSTPSDVVGLALLRILAEGRIQALKRQSQEEVVETLSSLRQDIGASIGQLGRLEGQCKTLIQTSGLSRQKDKNAIPQNFVWFWEFDGKLQDANRRYSIETYTGSYFATTLTSRAREAAIAELWARVLAARGNGAGTLDAVEESLGLRMKSDEFLRWIGTAIAQAFRESEQKGRDVTRTAFPCQYCAESESANSRAARNSKGSVVQDNPWIKSLIWSYEMTAETASRTIAEEFFRLVESRGASVTEVPGIKFLVDSTGGERRIVLVEMASVFDAMWKERRSGKRTSYHTRLLLFGRSGATGN